MRKDNRDYKTLYSMILTMGMLASMTACVQNGASQNNIKNESLCKRCPQTQSQTEKQKSTKIEETIAEA